MNLLQSLPTNCPNCGAPLTASGYCSYCNTKVRYANEVEFNTFIRNNSIKDIETTEILFKFKGNNNEILLIPFIGKPENVTIEYEECAATCHNGIIVSKVTTIPTIKFELVGHIKQ